MKYLIAWLLGVPITILIIIWGDQPFILTLSGKPHSRTP